MTSSLLQFKTAYGFIICVALFIQSANLYAATQSSPNTPEHNFQGYYDEPTAMALSIMPTVVGLTGGILLTAIKPTPARAITGLSLAALSLTVFPSLGYFYIHEHSTGIKKTYNSDRTAVLWTLDF